MNEEEKKNLIGKCQLTYDEDEGHYLTDGIMTEVSDTLQDVVIMHNIDSENVMCFTVCELANTLVGKMTAHSHVRRWAGSCFVNAYDRIPSTGELVDAEVFYELVARRRYNTFGYLKRRMIQVSNNGGATENLHYIFPIPRSVILGDKPLSKGEDPVFYLNGQRLDHFIQQDGFDMWELCYEKYVKTESLSMVQNNIYVHTDILELFKCRHLNKFNLIPLNQVMIGGSQNNLMPVTLYLVCPTNNENVLGHVPEIEMKECEAITPEHLHNLRIENINRINNEQVRENLLRLAEQPEPPEPELNPLDEGKRLIEKLCAELKRYNEEKVNDIRLPKSINEMQPSNEEFMREYNRKHNLFPNRRDILHRRERDEYVSEVLCFYIRGVPKNDPEVLRMYEEIVYYSSSGYRVKRLNELEETMQSLLEHPMPNFVKVVAKKVVKYDNKFVVLRSKINNAIRRIEEVIPYVPTLEELEPEIAQVYVTLHEYYILYNDQYNYLLHQNNLVEYTRSWIQEKLARRHEVHRVLEERRIRKEQRQQQRRRR